MTLKSFSKLWRSVHVKANELDLAATLTSGQSFRWKESSPGEWMGVIGRKVWILRQLDGELQYKTFVEANEDVKALDAVLTDYFQLHVPLSSLCKEWAAKDDKFLKMTNGACGVRVLRQDPTETLFAFICSTNNNIPRITHMVATLCSLYGEELPSPNETLHSFPDVKRLAEDGVESTLREQRFGYRAKFIQQAARSIVERGGSKWLDDLRGKDSNHIKSELLALAGIGPKVADCIMLMSLDCSAAIPVDTHVRQIAVRHLPRLAHSKSMTPRIYDEVVKHFQSMYGEYAGWAQAILFKADLKPSERSDCSANRPKKKQKKC